MRCRSLFLAHLIQSLRTPWTLFFVVAAVILALTAGLETDAPQDNRFTVGLVIEDEGTYGERLASAMTGYNNIRLLRLVREEALRMLRQDQLEGVFIVRADFTGKLRQSKFKETVEWYTAPSSRAAATVSEPLINETMRIWLEELIVHQTRAFLTDSGLLYTKADEDKQRAEIAKVWQTEAAVAVQDIPIEDSTPAEAEETPLRRETPLDACVRWYCLLCVFYLLISASWVLDINKRGLRIRAEQSGGHLWQILVGTSLAPLMIGIAGYWFVGALACLIIGDGWLRMIWLSLPVTIYLWTVLGMTIFLVSFLRQMLALMFLAPLLTFLNALLGGMIAELPDWAGVLILLSRLLPGRWLILTLGDAWTALPWALLCCACWFFAGVTLSEVRQSLNTGQATP